MKRKPICSFFGQCGGCSLLDIDYLEQLKLKQQKVKYVLQKNKIRHLPNLKIFFKEEYYYRNRMDFVFGKDGLGLREKGKFNKIVNLDECFIADGKINFLLSELNKWFEKNKEKLDVFDVKKTKGTLRYAVIRASDFDTSITFILNKDSEKISGQKELLLKYVEKSGANNILLGLVKHNSDLSSVFEYEILKGTDIIRENLCGFTYYYHTQGFFQINPSVLTDMMYLIKNNINEKYDVLVDVYGGVGTFGIFLSDKAEEIIVADNTPALYLAEKNMEVNEVKKGKAVFFDDKTPDLLFSNINFEKKHVFILDPPRSGIHKKTISHILKFLPERLIYISCNPERMGLELGIFSDKYDIRDIALFDIFPQTKHVETVVILQKKL